MIMWPFTKNSDAEEDWEKYFPEKTRYMKLQDECKKHGIPIYDDIPTGSASGDVFREPASEYELYRRLLERNTAELAKRAHRIAVMSLFIASLSFMVSLFL